MQGKVSGRGGTLSRRGDDPQLHPGAREGRRATGPAWSVEMSCHRIGGAKVGPL